MKPTIFLTNRELISEIHRCKATYTSFANPKYRDYDAIVRSLAEITPAFIEETRAEKSARLTPKRGEPVPVQAEGLVFRVMTFEHIPLRPADGKKGRARGPGRDYERVNFPPFKHFAYEAGELVEVGRSHWRGNFQTGHFDADKGRMTDRYARMLMLFVERLGRKGNWRSYSYNEDMQGDALAHLCNVGLQFDESKSANPFAYLTTCASNGFLRKLNSEKRQQRIRDDLLIEAGAAPSHTRQTADALAMSDSIANKIPRRRGRVSAKAKAAREQFEDQPAV